MPRTLLPNLALLALLATHASAQAPALPPEDFDPPIAPADVHNHEHNPTRHIEVPEHINQVTDALRELISAEFLTPDERLALRVKHGIWSHDDLIDRDDAAQAALDAGAYDHPFLLDPNTDPVLLAQGAITRGDPRRALGFLNAIDEPLTPQGNALLAQAHEMLGQTDEALDALITLENQLTSTQLNDADQIAWGAEGLLQLLRLRGPQTDARSEYEAITKLLATARESIDRTSWRVRLIEARLLYAHNNYTDGRNAAAETLLLHPRNAQAAFIIGSMAVDSFDFDTAEDIANKLDILAASIDESYNPDGYTPPSLLGTIIRARIELRRRDPEGAEIALDSLLARMPNQRELKQINAAASAAGFRTTSTQYLLDDYDDLSPGSPLAYMRVAETLSEYRQYEQAAEVYRRVIERAPHWGEPRLGLGLLLVQAGLDAEARDVLEDALKLDPFNLRAQNSLTLVTELATYDTIESEHFIIRYNTESTDIVLAREMPAIMERIHERVAGDMPGGTDYEPKQKTIIEVMPNHEWFAVRIAGMPSIHTMAASTGPVIAIEAPREGPKSSIGPYDWPRVLQHEYTHTVNLARTKNRVIHWMTEANAVFNEDAPRDANTWALLQRAYENDELFDLVDINTAFVRPKKPTDRAQAYAQGAWMFEYIVETYGKQAPLDIFDASTRGRDAVAAFEDALNVTPESFLASFKEWARQDLIDHKLLLPDDMPDIYELFGVSENDTPEQQLEKVPTQQDIAELLEQHPNHPELMTLMVGSMLAGAGDTLNEPQIEILERAIVVRPTDPEPHRRLARHHLASDEISVRLLAIPHLEYLDAREIHAPAYAGQLALLYAQNADHDKAIRAALRAVAIAPFDADQRERAARVALLAENYDLAKHQLESLIILEPDRDVHVRRLEALISKMDG
jgi:tetratricopeptide (TPR) repeat protein